MSYINREDTIKELQEYIDFNLNNTEKDKIIDQALYLAIRVIKKMPEVAIENEVTRG